MTSKDSPILIVGAGVFGLSLAYELTKNRGYTSVTVLDRFLPPVPDGSSVDVSRIIRTEYADPHYAALATDALHGWQTSELFGPHYHQSGFVMMADEREGPSAYFDKFRKWESGGRPAKEFYAPPLVDVEVKRRYKGVQADLKDFTATLNAIGGWADAAGAIRALAGRCTLAGVSFVTGRHGTVVSLERSGKRVTGVKTAAGTTLSADKIVLATGAWTNRIIPGMGHAMSASGQPVGFVQLSAEEAERVKDMPVMINMSTGVFCFPPTPGTNLLKLARHGWGFATEVEVEEGGAGKRTISTPRLRESNAASGYLPQDADEDLREGVRLFFPEFAEREWCYKRMCWYTDTPEGDFIADYHPDFEGLFFATGGAGHAFKFLPAIGPQVADSFERKPSTILREKWRLRRPTSSEEPFGFSGDGSRAGPLLRKLSVQEQSKL